MKPNLGKTQVVFPRIHRRCMQLMGTACHLTLAVAGGQSSGEIKSRVDGHPVSLRDRVLMKKFSVSPRMEEHSPESRDGSKSLSGPAVARLMSTDLEFTSQERVDGLSVCLASEPADCEVVGRLLRSSATTTATAILDGMSVVPTCTPSTLTASNDSNFHVRSTTRVARTTSSIHPTQPPVGSVVSLKQEEGTSETGEMDRGMTKWMYEVGKHRDGCPSSS